MSADYINALTENASRLGMRIQEQISEHTRDLNFTTNASAAAYLDTSEDKVKNIRRQLESSSDREKLDAMKRLIALISKGRNVSEYFAQVVKNVASHNLEIRKLVYIYLLRYAEQEPDLALLSINTFQRDLTDSSPLIRSMALRVLSGIKVPMIGSIVVLAIKRCAADMSPYVRKAAALAIPKCYEMDMNHLPALIEILTTLLNDRSNLSIGSVILAFEAICPTRLDLLHPQYRRLCRILVDVDEWGQIELMKTLLRYARTMLPRPTEESNGSQDVDKDLQLLLSSSEPLLQSRNPAVVMGVVRIFYQAGTRTLLPKVVPHMLRLLHMSNEIERVVLSHIFFLVQETPNLFSPYYTRFFVRSTDTAAVKQLKVQLLARILDFENHQAILKEFIDYGDDTDEEFVSQAVRAIGHCSASVSECTSQCVSALTAMIQSKRDALVSSAVIVLKDLVQSQRQLSSPTMQSRASIISTLAQKLDNVRNPQARACIIWLAGQYAATDEPNVRIEGIANWAPDILRKAAKGFSSEARQVKLQIVTMAAKLLVLSPTDRTLALLVQYVFSLARYDQDYDLRDRARMLSSLLIGVLPEISGADVDLDQRGGVILRREQVKLVLFEGKGWTDLQVGTNKDHSKQPSVGSIGTLSSVIGKTMGGSVSLPEWLEQGVASTLRDSPFDAPAAPEVPTAISSSNLTRSNNVSRVLTPVGSPMPPVPVGAPYLNLDEFYAEDETSDEEEDEDEDDDDDDDDDDDEEEEEEGEEGEEGKEEVVVEEEEGETGDDGEVEEEAESSDEARDPMKRGELQEGGKSAQSS